MQISCVIFIVVIVVAVLLQLVDPRALKKMKGAKQLEGHMRALREVCEINYV